MLSYSYTHNRQQILHQSCRITAVIFLHRVPRIPACQYIFRLCQSFDADPTYPGLIDSLFKQLSLSCGSPASRPCLLPNNNMVLDGFPPYPPHTKDGGHTRSSTDGPQWTKILAVLLSSMIRVYLPATLSVFS